jgi:hypothetical protein
MSKVRQ